MGILSNVIETFCPASPTGIGHFTFMPHEELAQRLKEYAKDTPDALIKQARLDTIERYLDELYILRAMAVYSMRQVERWHRSPPAYPDCGFKLNALPLNLSDLELTLALNRAQSQIFAIEAVLGQYEAANARDNSSITL